MADDEKTETPKEKAAEAAGEAAAAVTEHAEAVESNAAGAIENAQRQADDAKRAADEIARAALNTELGAQIQRTGERFDTWRTEHETRVNTELAKIPLLETQLAETRTALGTLLGALKPADPLPSTPPVSDNPPADGPKKNPDDASPAGHEEVKPQAPPRKKHLL